jgi:hypothetical protein
MAEGGDAEEDLARPVALEVAFEGLVADRGRQGGAQPRATASRRIVWLT